MMRNSLWLVALAAGVFAVQAPAQEKTEAGMVSNEETGRSLCEMLDLARPDLAAVRGHAESGDYAGALAAYRDRLVELAAHLDMGDPPGFWLWGATKAEDLLKTGVVGTAQYGEFSTVSHYTLGMPGSVDWNTIPDDGYDVVLRDVATMHWVGRLAEAYRKTQDPAYLKAFLGYWDDFALNWLPAHEEFLRNGGRIQWDERPHVQTSVNWASKSKLYFAWRLDNLFSWLPAAIAVSPAQAKAALDPVQLAHVVLHVARFEVPGAIRGLQSVGTPNQFVHCAVGLLKTSLVLQDLREAPSWTDTAISRMEWYLDSCGYLPDGSDMEQSFNYNPGLIHALETVMSLARNNPPLAGRDLPWMAKFKQAHDWRRRFLDAVVMPDGRRPATGCDNTWRYSRERAVEAYSKNKGTLPPLREHVDNHLFGDATLPAPAFTSIYFPYGGWVAMRGGWEPTSLYAFMKTSRPGPGHMREGGNGLAVAAYGRYLLVNSGDDSYSDRGVFSRYFHSTVSQTSVSVDGYSQQLHAAHSKPDFSRPIEARWHASERFDVAEGIFDSAYGGWNFRTGQVSKTAVDDVKHVRQLIFVRNLGVWVVTDRLFSETPHQYTQSWCLGPEFTPETIKLDAGNRAAATDETSGANVALRWFSTSSLTCSLHYGEKSDATALGWRALGWDDKTQSYAPASDLLVDWQGPGNHIVVTLIVPSQDESTRITTCDDLCTDGVNGFHARLSDGAEISYLASAGGSLQTAGVETHGEALLVVTGADGKTHGLSLDSQRGGQVFEVSPQGKTRRLSDIFVPTGFRWEGEGPGLHPVHRP
jgi:hypothetical protein